MNTPPPAQAEHPDHAALMDRIYRWQRSFYDLTRKYYLFGRDSLIRDLNLSPGESLIEIGCGTARNLIAIAKHYPGTRLYGLDASAAMLETAQKAVSRAGLGDRIRLTQGYAEALSPSMFGLEKGFDHAMFSYSLSMIPDWKQSLVAANRALVSGGALHVVDFGDLAGMGALGRSILLAWLDLFHVAPRTELLERFAHEPNLRLLPGRYAFLVKIAK